MHVLRSTNLVGLTRQSFLNCPDSQRIREVFSLLMLHGTLGYSLRSHRLQKKKIDTTIQGDLKNRIEGICARFLNSFSVILRLETGNLEKYGFT